ncbi:hypothetical protein ILUMI_26593 [Ignelater luminosus]|uniref:Uncharacterized protein n=1 Tax=Ignelater luminosus TaxID=2038154 RepID=A0A8K0FYS4_IGNLU|nr:hypothetical protein ILUMI_26593 [Ignelater luminosus]
MLPGAVRRHPRAQANPSTHPQVDQSGVATPSTLPEGDQRLRIKTGDPPAIAQFSRDRRAVRKCLLRPRVASSVSESFSGLQQTGAPARGGLRCLIERRTRSSGMPYANRGGDAGRELETGPTGSRPAVPPLPPWCYQRHVCRTQLTDPPSSLDCATLLKHLRNRTHPTKTLSIKEPFNNSTANNTSADCDKRTSNLQRSRPTSRQQHQDDFSLTHFSLKLLHPPFDDVAVHNPKVPQRTPAAFATPPRIEQLPARQQQYSPNPVTQSEGAQYERPTQLSPLHDAVANTLPELARPAKTDVLRPDADAG